MDTIPPPPPEPKSKRGGRRPGAGAPKGNLNALKHGGRSLQLARVGAILAVHPTIRDALLDIGRRQLDQQLKAEEVAGIWIARLLRHAEDIARGKPSPGPFAHLLENPAAPGADQHPEIKALNDALSAKHLARRPLPNTKARRPRKKHAPTKSNPQHEPRDQSPPRYKNTPAKG